MKTPREGTLLRCLSGAFFCVEAVSSPGFESARPGYRGTLRVGSRAARQGNEGWAIQAAEKLIRAVGRGFIPGKKADRMNVGFTGCGKLNRAVGRGFIPGKRPMESACALAPEVCSSRFSPDSRPFSQPVKPEALDTATYAEFLKARQWRGTGGLEAQSFSPSNSHYASFLFGACCGPG
jgi:hypothetical protein